MKTLKIKTHLNSNDSKKRKSYDVEDFKSLIILFNIFKSKKVNSLLRNT